MILWQDTLVGLHSIASHFRMGLDSAVSIYGDAECWKITHGKRGASSKKQAIAEMTGEELCLYNAKDAVLTAKVWKRMQHNLEKERHVYEHDLCLFQLCNDMQRVGIRVDVARQRQLSVAMGVEADRYQDEMRKLLKNPSFAPSKNDDVRKALYTTLSAKKISFTPTGLPAANKAVLEAMRGLDTDAGRFAEMMGKWRELRKIKKTYVDYPKRIMFHLGNDKPYDSDPHRAHYSWGPRERRDRPTSGGGHTVSGRLACRLQSISRYNFRNLADRAREIYVPAKGHVFTYFDVSQGEPRVAAYLSGDPERIRTTLGDVHAENAKIMFPETAAKGWLDGDAKKDPTRGKPVRDLAKTMGLAIDYFAEAETAFAYMNQNRFGPDGKALFGMPLLGTVAAIISKIRFRYRVYVKYVMKNMDFVKKSGYLRSPVLGRIRWLGRNIPITYVANSPVQSCLADVMNLRSLFLQGSPQFFAWMRKNPEIAERVSLPKKPIRLPKNVQLCAQIHDSCIFDSPKREANAMKEILAEVWSSPIHLEGGALILPIDFKIGERLSEL